MILLPSFQWNNEWPMSSVQCPRFLLLGFCTCIYCKSFSVGEKGKSYTITVITFGFSGSSDSTLNCKVWDNLIHIPIFLHTIRAITTEIEKNRWKTLNELTTSECDTLSSISLGSIHNEGRKVSKVEYCPTRDSTCIERTIWKIWWPNEKHQKEVKK